MWVFKQIEKNYSVWDEKFLCEEFCFRVLFCSVCMLMESFGPSLIGTLGTPSSSEAMSHALVARSSLSLPLPLSVRLGRGYINSISTPRNRPVIKKMDGHKHQILRLLPLAINACPYVCFLLAPQTSLITE